MWTLTFYIQLNRSNLTKLCDARTFQVFRSESLKSVFFFFLFLYQMFMVSLTCESRTQQ